MDNKARVALVTGANRGMGLETCRALARLGMRVLLAARDPERGAAAAAELGGEGLAVEYERLDVTREADIGALGARLAERHARLDVLINNAGVLSDSRGPRGDGASVFNTPLALMRETLEINTLGPMRLCQELVPLMRKHAYGRIVNVSSGMGQLSEMNGHYPAYRLSKAALNALTRILADELQDTGIKVNSACPGWVRTDMGGPGAERSVSEGVDTTVWLATLPDDGPSGGFFRSRQAIAW